jgi:hypothetical protein
MALVSLARGLNWKTVIRFENKTVEILSETWSLEEIGEEHTDQINGETRAWFDKTLDGYMLNLGGVLRDEKVIKLFLDWSALRETNTRMPVMDAGIQFGPNNGSKHTYTGSGIVLGLCKIDNGGRKTTTKAPIKLFMQNFKKLS